MIGLHVFADRLLIIRVEVTLLGVDEIRVSPCVDQKAYRVESVRSGTTGLIEASSLEEAGMTAMKQTLLRYREEDERTRDYEGWSPYLYPIQWMEKAVESGSLYSSLKKSRRLQMVELDTFNKWA